jgi:hypothetical protein
MRRIVALVWMTSALLLTGCATTRVVNSQVRAVATVPAGAQLQGAKYRFERLPLQAHNPEAGLAEQQAEQALAAVGLLRDDAQAQLSVQVGFNSEQYVYDPAGRWGAYPWRPYGSLGFGRNGAWGYNLGWGMPNPPQTDYRREVSLVLRDLRSGLVVYETHASHYGIWRDSEPIFATLFKAALANFPNPPAGVQRVNIEIPR